jgi:TonB family protein
MNLRLMSVCALVAMFVMARPGVESSAQRAVGADTSQGEVVMTKLMPPVYPPLARQARVTGDVEVTVNVRADGSVASVNQVSGHPLLVQAAVASAQNSQYECRKCSATETSYPFVYSFQLGDSAVSGTTLRQCTPREAHQFGSLVIESQDQVTLVAQPICAYANDGINSVKKVRSLKCVYLWRCGYSP